MSRCPITPHPLGVRARRTQDTLRCAGFALKHHWPYLFLTNRVIGMNDGERQRSYRGSMASSSGVDEKGKKKERTDFRSDRFVVLVQYFRRNSLITYKY